MNQFISFVKKEFYHISRDKRTLFILLVMPIVQIIIFGFALTNEVKDSSIAILDQSKDAATQSIATELDASNYFTIQKKLRSYKEVEAEFKKAEIKMVIVFPQNFASDLKHFNKAQIQLITDASDPNLANTMNSYASNIIMDYQSRMNDGLKLPYSIRTEYRMLYNPQLKGAYSFVPGVMSMVLMLICTMMTAITIVKEKELGTMEIMLVSPVQPLKIVIAKAVPYLLLSIINISTILLLSVFVLDVPINGSIILLVSEAILFTLTSLALGLLISTATDSQQTAMFISLTGMFLPTVMLSGFMFPIENMPLPLQIISNIVPAKWFYFIVKSVMIKGVGLGSVWRETLILAFMTSFFLLLSIKKFKIRLA
ncbi:ABC transporter permease [Desertivirga brevis]|uniref:ABC transporter permease n=1 Tax=Desertivirga brevis TaxID=2810310 RepID=UPI001A960791|nr:ABC transporter permease [Pedobacter sp. SYSU D00873]